MLVNIYESVFDVKYFSYSTWFYTEPHNLAMEYKTWLKTQLDELGMTPTTLAREYETLGINQPTILRMVNGTTKNPSIDVILRVGQAISHARAARGLPPADYLVGKDLKPLSDRVSVEAQTLPRRIQLIVKTIAQQRHNGPLLSAIEAMLDAASTTPRFRRDSDAQPLNLATVDPAFGPPPNVQIDTSPKTRTYGTKKSKRI